MTMETPRRFPAQDRARALKDKRRAKASKKAPAATEANSAPAKPKFGDVVQRPPSFSKEMV